MVMKALRSKRTMRNVLKVTLILVIPSFVAFYGWGSNSRRRDTGSAFDSVTYVELKGGSGLEKSKLTLADMQQARDQIVGDMAMQLGRNVDYNQIRENLTNMEVAQEAVNIAALRQVANQNNLVVTRAELTSYLSQMFPGRQTQEIVAGVQSSGQDFRTWIANRVDEMRLSKAEQLIQSASYVTLPQLWQQYQRRNTKVSLDYAQFEVADLAGEMPVSAEEIAEEYKARRESLEIADQAVYRYVAVLRADVMNRMKIADEDIKAYYDKEREERYKRPEMATVRLVLLQTPAEDKEGDASAAVYKRIVEIYDKASSAGVSLAELANQYSEDPANVMTNEEDMIEGPAPEVKLGGLNPSVTRSQEVLWGPEFIEAVFTAPLGEIQKPLLTKRGWVVFAVEDRRDASYVPFESVREEIKNRIRSERIEEEMESARRSMEEARRAATTLEGLARAIGADVKTTSPVLTSADLIPGIGSVRDYRVDMRELQPGGEPTYVMDTGRGYAVVEMQKFLPRHIPPMEEVAERLKKEIQARKALRQIVSQAQELARRVNAGDSLTSLAIEMNLKRGRSEEAFSVSEPQFPFSMMQDLAAWVARTPQGGAFITCGAKVGDTPRTVYVCQVARKIEPSREEFLKEMGQLEFAMLMAQRDSVLQEYLRDARKRLNPRYNPDYLGEESAEPAP